MLTHSRDGLLPEAYKRHEVRHSVAPQIANKTTVLRLHRNVGFRLAAVLAVLDLWRGHECHGGRTWESPAVSLKLCCTAVNLDAPDRPATRRESILRASDGSKLDLLAASRRLMNVTQKYILALQNCRDHLNGNRCAADPQP